MNAAVEVHRRGVVTVVTLSRPDVRNAVDALTARTLYDAFAAFDQEWERGKDCIGEGLVGAERFAKGAGRHGS